MTASAPVPGPVLATESLETAELLALLFDGSRARSLGKAHAVLAERGLAELASATPAALTRELQLAPRAAERVCAALQLGRRLLRAEPEERPSLRSAQRVHAWLGPQLCGLEQEVFVVLLLDGRHRLRRQQLVTVGTLTSSIVHPREVFRAAVREAAGAVLVAHNHPSGDPEPSQEDVEVTRRLCAAGDLLGIPLLDHVVVARDAFVSLRERMGFPLPRGVGRTSDRDPEPP